MRIGPNSGRRLTARIARKIALWRFMNAQAAIKPRERAVCARSSASAELLAQGFSVYRFSPRSSTRLPSSYCMGPGPMTQTPSGLVASSIASMSV